MFSIRTLILAAVALASLLSSCTQTSTSSRQHELETQYGTPHNDSVSFVITNENGHLYTWGDTYYDEDVSAEMVLKRFSPSGQELWSYGFGDCGSQCSVIATGAGIDTAGNAYLLETASGADVDAYATLYKVGPEGKLLWSQGVSLGVVTTSATGETFLASGDQRLIKYGSGGELLFDKPLAVPADDLAVAGDGSLYTFGDAKVAKYSSAGMLLWQRSVPLAFTYPNQIAVGGNSVYLSSGSSNSAAIRLYKYSFGGTLVWQRSITPIKEAYASDLSADAWDNVYLTGATNADYDFFTRKYTHWGGVAWTYKPNLRGTTELATGVSAADSGKVYVVGMTNGNVNGKNFGGQDAFLLRLGTRGKKVWSR